MPQDGCLAEQELLEKINATSEIASRGFLAETCETGGVVLTRGQHVRGLWRFDGCFHFTSIASGERILFARSVEAAVLATLKLILDIELAVKQDARRSDGKRVPLMDDNGKS